MTSGIFPMTRAGIFTYLAGAGLILPAALLAQPIEPRVKPAPQKQQQEDTTPPVRLRADANLVLVPVEVSDSKNRTVTGLGRENFRIFDNQIEQSITAFSMDDDPLALCLVYDVSSSMGGNTMGAWNSAREYAHLANPGDEFCAVIVRSDAKLAVPLTADEHGRDIDDRLFEVKGGGSTALLDGVYYALSELKKSKKLKRVMLIISDGLDNNSRYSLGEVMTAVKESDVIIYGGGPGGGLASAIGDKQVLPDLVDATGGNFVRGAMSQVILDLRNRYILGFSPTNAARDGKLHRLSVKVLPPKGLPKVFVHWKTGYYAPVN